MTEPLWEPYEDALRLILTGSIDNTLYPEERGIFVNMLAQGLRDEDGNLAQKRNLPDVQTREYCTDEEKQEYQTHYYIPDVFRFMVKVHEEQGTHALPVNIEYLSSLKDDSDNILFNLGDALSQHEWIYSPEGQKYWALLCKKIEIRKKFSKLERANDEGKASEMESQENLSDKWNDELAVITKKLATINAHFEEEYVSLEPSNRDQALQNAANTLAKQWKQDNHIMFSKGDIAKELAKSDEWKLMTAGRIERIIRKQW